ncbi:hypothetical protein KR767_04080 [Luteibacter anthropi]|uniref:phage tail tube protein n=1 Tax=Luteibacter anthropi TaxID=564369 RepID=UPI002032E9CD|nr:hypothetical protein [Luteibacter anthropi]URX63255.1 hypothetical protein KR767_04080 [Luteibacter anthropi]
MSATTEYFSMQGKVALGIRNPDGSRQPAKWVYDASTLEWGFSVDKDEKNENWSGARGLAATLQTKKTMTVKLTLGQLNDTNAAQSVAGTAVAIAAGTVTAEAIGTPDVGDMVGLEYAKVAEVVLKAGAATLTKDTDYTLNPATGVLTFLTKAASPVSAAYSYSAHSLVTVFSGSNPDMYVLFDGENTVDGATGKCRGEVNRITFDPASTLALINSTFGEMELNGSARVDPLRISNPRYGGYARLILVDPEV